ncbi:MAG: aminodeoxychorismate lyase [Bacillus sp. (in: firmicutes)]
MIGYQNGQYVREEEMSISPFDHGFLYGMGIFETIRLYEGHPFLLDGHLRRLNEGLQTLYIDYVLEKEEVVEILQQLSTRNGLQHARVRINVSAGEGVVGLPQRPYTKPNILVFISPLPEPHEQLHEKDAVLLNIRRNTPETDRRLKSLHYGNNIAAKMELQHQPECEGIFLNEEGYVAEAITSNIFFVKKKTLYTPEQSTGILLGITRQFILLLADELGFSVQEGCYTVDEIAEAEEVFITNSIQEIVAIREIVDVGKYKGASGQVTNALFGAYKQNRSIL